MQTRLPEALRQSPEGQEANAILRSCVHCGFCTATCPTYQLLGDELDGPRGRIYLIKQALEGQPASLTTLQHLDRCLQCRNCETTCPSGVRYTRLLEIGKQHLSQHVRRPWHERWLRRMLAFWLPHRRLNRMAFSVARVLRPLLPKRLAHHLPCHWHTAKLPTKPPAQKHVVLFQGCVESTLMGSAHQAARQLIHARGHAVRYLPKEQCCGAVEHHLDQAEAAKTRALNNVLQWQAALAQGAEAILLLSSACLLEIRHYPQLLGEQAPDDLADILRQVMGLDEWLVKVLPEMPDGPTGGPVVAWHPPCTLQHGLRQPETIPQLLSRAGYQVLLARDSHLCCGAAGTYTLLQGRISQALGQARRQALQAVEADAISTANIGCLLQLQDPNGPPVRHWAELLAERLVS